MRVRLSPISRPIKLTRAVIADSVLRALPEDGTNGFFVACFVRSEAEEFQLAPTEVTSFNSNGAGEILSHSERQEAFKKKSVKGEKGAKVEKRDKKRGRGARDGDEEEDDDPDKDFGPRVKNIPMPTGKTAIGGKNRLAAPAKKAKVVTKIVSAAPAPAPAKKEVVAPVSAAVTVVAPVKVFKEVKEKKTLSLEEKVMLKKRKSFERLGASARSARPRA